MEQEKGELLIDTARVVVSGAVPEIPTIRKFATGKLARLSSNFASSYAATGSRGGPTKFNSEANAFTSDTIRALPLTGKLISEDVTDGKRVAVVELAVSYSKHPSKHKASSNALDGMLGSGTRGDGVQRALADQEGRFIPGLGRVTETQVVKHEYSDHGQHSLKVALTFVSKTV